MSKFPLLDQLRSDYQRQDEDAIAPVRSELNGRINSLQAGLSQIRSVVGSEMGRNVLEHTVHEFQSLVRRKITEACMQAARGPGIVRLELDAEVIRWMDPQSLEREVLARFTRQAMPALNLCLLPSAEPSAVVLEIRLPEMVCRHSVLMGRE